jgi:FkbM family methyltransferase
MIEYFKRKIEKRRLKKTFKEYGYEIEDFEIDGFGKIQYAHWLHPFVKRYRFGKSQVDFYRKLSRPGGMIVDIGAHVGDTTVPMGLAVGKEGLVLGIEPNQYAYKILETNASLNKEITNILPHCFAATEKEGIVTFNYSDASFCNGGFLSQIRNKRHRHNYTLDVKGLNLEKFLLDNHANDLEKLDLIKIDAEGYDKEIIKTLPRILAKYKPQLMVECYKRLTQEERDDLYDTISGFGYELYLLENFKMFHQLEKIEKHNMNDRKHFEMLAVHAEKKQTLFSA